MNDVSEFERESRRIDEQIWDALALRARERALFLGLANEGAWAARAIEIGVEVTVLARTGEQVARAERMGATVMRGSATMLPFGEGTYDVAIAMHFLHEIDPGFHANVVSEMARVARRVAIVEPAPPADALGKRIASLYARAKRENGQFESYQPIEYWRKLLSVVKAEVWQNLLTFNRVPPKRAVAETVTLILDAMAIEEMPPAYLDELRELAARPDAQLLPLSRIVLVGTASGETVPHGNGVPFRLNAPPTRKTAVPVIARPVPDTPIWPSGSPPPPSPNIPTISAPAPERTSPTSAPAPPPAPSPPPPTSAPRAAPPEAPERSAPPFGTPFALPQEPAGEEPPFGGDLPGTKSGFGWAWEPPDLEDTKPEK